MKSFVLFLAFLVISTRLPAGRSDRTLEVYWVDSEGGGSTLIVTPAGESVLIDTGNPGGRDSQRIFAVAQSAGLRRIDHVVITHFHRDHYGGAAELSALMPLGTLHDKGIPDGDPNGKEPSTFPLEIKPYREMAVEKRVRVGPGTVIPLKASAGAAPIELRCLGANQAFVDPTPAQARERNPLSGTVPAKPVDRSDNANSVVLVLQFGGFRFFDGGDLTWNLEDALVCPHNRVGLVDVYQTNHHGLDVSNNPVLIRSLAPSVVVMNNGPRKGGEPGVFATLKSLPSLQALWQVHRNLRVGPEGNAPADFIANHVDSGEEHDGKIIKMTVSPDGMKFTIVIPSTGFSRTYATRAK